MAVTADPGKRGKPGKRGILGERATSDKRATLGERSTREARGKSGPRARKASTDARRGAGSDRIGCAIREQQRALATASAEIETARAEDVHHARVAARRLRSLLKTFHPLFDPRRAQRYRADLKRFAHALTEVREADVRRALLLSLSQDDAVIVAADRKRLDAVLTEQGNRARDSLRTWLREPEWAELSRALDRHGASESLVVVLDAGEGSVLALAAASWRRARKLLADAPRTATGLHELRLALKHCRYALEPVDDEAPQAAAPLMRSLRRAQETLGEHRDTQLAQLWVELNGRALGRTMTMHLVGALEQDERNLRRQAVRRIRKVFAAWKVWRDATRSLRKASPRPESSASPG